MVFAKRRSAGERDAQPRLRSVVRCHCRRQPGYRHAAAVSAQPSDLDYRRRRRWRRCRGGFERSARTFVSLFQLSVFSGLSSLCLRLRRRVRGFAASGSARERRLGFRAGSDLRIHAELLVERGGSHPRSDRSGVAIRDVRPLRDVDRGVVVVARRAGIRIGHGIRLHGQSRPVVLGLLLRVRRQRLHQRAPQPRCRRHPNLGRYATHALSRRGCRGHRNRPRRLRHRVRHRQHAGVRVQRQRRDLARHYRQFGGRKGRVSGPARLGDHPRRRPARS